MKFIYLYSLIALCAYQDTKYLIKANKIPLPVKNHLGHYFSLILRNYLVLLTLVIMLQLFLKLEQGIIFNLKAFGPFTVLLEVAIHVFFISVCQVVFYQFLTRKPK